MTLLVVSDIHGGGYRLGELIDKHPRHDGFLFLGDGLRDLETEEHRINGLAAVSGNCDLMSYFAMKRGGVPEEFMLELDGFRILMMHGHTHGVKSGYERAIAYADRRGADILLCGHTHAPLETYYPAGTEFEGFSLSRPLYLFNPGSLGEPRGGAPSYGVMEIRNCSVLFSHGRL